MPVTAKEVTAEEIKALKTVANLANGESLSRYELEKLSRLDLIEPCAAGVCLSVKGQEILVKRK